MIEFPSVSATANVDSVLPSTVVSPVHEDTPTSRPQAACEAMGSINTTTIAEPVAEGATDPTSQPAATGDDIAETPASRKRKHTEQRYTELQQEERDEIMKIVYLLDRFSGSDALYHEMTQLYKEIPRSYMVWFYRRQLDKSFHVKQLDGTHEGAYIPITPLLQAHICKLLTNKGADNVPNDGVHIKISGDGAEFSRSFSSHIANTQTTAGSSYCKTAAVIVILQLNSIKCLHIHIMSKAK